MPTLYASSADLANHGYDRYAAGFRWTLPPRLNMGEDIVTRWALTDPDRTALLIPDGAGVVGRVSYGQLDRLSNRLANALTAQGIQRGDRVAILLPQSLEAVVSHIAAYKMGVIALPLAVMFGADALSFRLQRSGARALVAETQTLERLEGLDLPDVVIATDGHGAGDWTALTARASDQFPAVATSPRDAALMIFTSGTTGMPKPTLLGHSVLAGHLPGIHLAQDQLGRPGDLMWTPADWAWAGGLLNALLPALHAGVPVLSYRAGKFDPEAALSLMAQEKVTNAFLPPTALKLMRPLTNIRQRHALALRAVGSAGEALGREAYHFGREELGIVINEFYGQTECNAVIGSAHAHGVGRSGATGKAYPGHRVAVVNADGEVLPPGIQGQIAIHRPDPVMFLGYAGDQEATADKFRGDWMVTGDSAVMDEDGYFHFIGRDDDVITSAGYRIGPGEIEDCLLAHPAVELAVVVGKPDPVRTEIVKAYVVVKTGFSGDARLAAALRDHVRARLSAHEYPREIDFVDAIPMTTTGKLIRRHFRDVARTEAGVSPSDGI